MTDLRKAVELADGFVSNHECIDILTDDGTYRLWASADWDGTPKFVLDALAAQLVRQVDATGTHVVHVYESYAEVSEHPGIMQYNHVSEGLGPDRTENTINAILESGVLE